MAMKLKYLSSFAEDVVKRCSDKLDTTVEKLVEEFEAGWNPDYKGNYCKNLVEFCSGMALSVMCHNIEEKINDGSFSRLTYDMMLAWERPSYYDEHDPEPMETIAKEKEESIAVNAVKEQEDIPLFYSDIMPLLVTNEPSVGEDAFVWLGSLVPLVSDVANGRCIRHLQKQATPTGVKLADDEFILHVEGTASSQRVIRHIGGTSWPGRLTLSNYALYFEASGVIKYDNALKIDLSKDTEQSVKPAATGPWGAQLFDKAIVYNSADLSEEIVIEFPELTSSTRRDHWLALIREIMFLHQFLSKYNIKSSIQSWEMHARTMLGIIRLHAAREMQRISPPVPTKFLIFSLYNEVPKGDYVLEEIAENLNKVNSGHSCSASSILRNMNISRNIVSDIIVEEASQAEESPLVLDDSPSLHCAIDQSREEEKEVLIAKATTEELKDEGITDAVLVLTELLKPLKSLVPKFQEILTWESPRNTLAVLAASLIITFMEWVGKAIAAFLIWLVVMMLELRRKRISEKCNEIVISRSSMSSDQSTMESIVSAQHGFYTLHDMLQIANIAILKIWSILTSKADKHANIAMVAMIGAAVLLAVIPFKYFLMGAILQSFIMTYPKTGNSTGPGNRRLKEWWDSIPIVSVHVVD
ncbi:unnamed protein product [Lupinus luteus]|uniref:DUF639 domain-containing protein n=1 Tax=Lupinus luteus TaxID=3873 RepID=A0AAV1XLY7_LUPLU